MFSLIRTTDEHPFYVQGRGWVRAGELRIGDLLQETDGSWQAVLASEREDYSGGITVYNLEVEGDHTYFVEDGFGAADAVWVHNAYRCNWYSSKPAWVKNDRTWMGWLVGLTKGNRLSVTKQEADALVEDALKYNVYIRLDPPHGPNNPWNVPHFNIGNSANVHVEVPVGHSHPSVPRG